MTIWPPEKGNDMESVSISWRQQVLYQINDHQIIEIIPFQIIWKVEHWSFYGMELKKTTWSQRSGYIHIRLYDVTVIHFCVKNMES